LFILTVIVAITFHFLCDVKIKDILQVHKCEFPFILLEITINK